MYPVFQSKLISLIFSVRIPFVPGNLVPTSGAELIENDVLIDSVAFAVIHGGDDEKTQHKLLRFLGE